MSRPRYVLAIDQGTTSSTAVLVDREMRIVARHSAEFPQIYPQPAWVEHDPEAIWGSVEQAVRGVLEAVGEDGGAVAAIGITNQRETTLVWEREGGRAIYPAIVWQCRRTAEICRKLIAEGHEADVKEKTGLVLDPYFSATKVRWILDEVEGAQARADNGELAFGTVDSFLVWRLSGGRVHVTDVSNASRTLLMDIHEGRWSETLLEIFDVPAAILPEIRPSSEVYGETRGLGFLPDGIPIAGMAGDQQAALFGQACFEVGATKATYGTGAFVLMNTGAQKVSSEHGLLTTVAWQLGGDAPLVYALEGSVFVAGAAVQWLRDELGVIKSSAEVESLARQVPDADGVMMIPAFTGLGAPYWNPEARGAILGLTRGSTAAHIARATLDGIAQQVTDVVEAMVADVGGEVGEGALMLKVDGGAAANDLLMQTQADLIGVEVMRPEILETTVFGAALLAALAVGFFDSLEAVSEQWKPERRFEGEIGAEARRERRARWDGAIRALNVASSR